jgi:hypothetical protein
LDVRPAQWEQASTGVHGVHCMQLATASLQSCLGL